MTTMESVKEQLIDRLDTYTRLINQEHNKVERDAWWERWYEIIIGIDAINKMTASEYDNDEKR
jgi:hypothetical protein